MFHVLRRQMLRPYRQAADPVHAEEHCCGNKESTSRLEELAKGSSSR
jgi:hypothetical protein